MPTETLYGPHETLPFVTIGLILVTVIVSIAGFRDTYFVERFIFSPQYILRDRQGYRLITSAFLHADVQHLFFNMFSLYIFGRNIELRFGVTALLAIYFASIIGGSLLSLWLHRHHVYKAYGASGGVFGIIYAHIFLFPGAGIFMFMIPVAIPAWLYAIAYLLLTFYGIKKAADNVGHDAHLGGAMIGLLTTTALYPQIVGESPRLYIVIMVLSLGMFIYLIKNPLFLPLDTFGSSYRPELERPVKPAKPKEKTPDINAILDKISKSGMKSLSKAEHKALLEASQKGRKKDN